MDYQKLNIAAVIVTYKNIEMLKSCINGIEKQVYPVSQIVVVNNGGMDSTASWLGKKPDIITINQENSGGAGGFNSGIKKAYDLNVDWVWCLDQDIITYKDTLSNLLSSASIHEFTTGFISSIILNKDLEPIHINVPQFDNNYNVIREVHRKNEIPILCCSFSSVLINSSAINISGLPHKDFFIWGDDSEFTLRIVKNGFKGYLIPGSSVIHNVDMNLQNPFAELDGSDLKYFYGLRNFFYINLLKHKVMGKSKMHGLLSSFYFYFRVFKERLQKKRFKGIVEIGTYFIIFIKAIFFKPTK